MEIEKPTKKIIQLEYSVIPIACLLYFLVSVDVISVFVYTIIALLLSLYFLPFRFINFKYEKTKQDQIIFSIGSIIISLSLIFSIALAYNNNSVFFSSVFTVLSLLNFGLVVFSYLKSNDRKHLILHFLFVFFTSVVNTL